MLEHPCYRELFSKNQIFIFFYFYLNYIVSVFLSVFVWPMWRNKGVHYSFRVIRPDVVGVSARALNTGGV